MLSWRKLLHNRFKWIHWRCRTINNPTTSGGDLGAGRPSVSPCERVQPASLIIQIEPMAHWESIAFLSPKDKQPTTCSLAQRILKNKKTTSYDKVERVSEACDALLVLMSLRMSLKKDSLEQVALLPRRDEKDIMDHRMIPNYSCGAGSTSRLHWVPSHHVLIWVSVPEMVPFQLWS